MFPSSERLKEIFIGILMIILAKLLIFLILEMILHIQDKPCHTYILTIVACIILAIPSILSFTVGYKLIRYKNIIERDINTIQKIVNKYYNEYINEVLGDLDIIILSGVDGSGKSTQAGLLKEFLSKKHIKVQVFWARWSSFLSYCLYLYARVLKRTIKVKVHDRDLKVHIFYVDTFLRRFYPIFQLIDFSLRYSLLIFYSKIRHIRIIIFDRFLLDLVVDLLWEVRDSSILKDMFLRALMSKMLKKHIIIFTAEVPIIINRKTDIYSTKELSFKKRIYEIIARGFNIPVIDTSYKNITLTFREVLQYLRIPCEIL